MAYTERAETVAVSRGTSHVTSKQRCNHFGGYVSHPTTNKLSILSVLMEVLSHANVKKKKKCLRILKFTLLLVVFKWNHGSEGVYCYYSTFQPHAYYHWLCCLICRLGFFSCRELQAATTIGLYCEGGAGAEDDARCCSCPPVSGNCFVSVWTDEAIGLAGICKVRLETTAASDDRTLRYPSCSFSSCLETIARSDDKTSRYPSCSFSSLPSVEIKVHRRHRHQEIVLRWPH